MEDQATILSVDQPPAPAQQQQPATPGVLQHHPLSMVCPTTHLVQQVQYLGFTQVTLFIVIHEVTR